VTAGDAVAVPSLADRVGAGAVVVVVGAVVVAVAGDASFERVVVPDLADVSEVSR
jgi:hypothetical protein